MATYQIYIPGARGCSAQNLIDVGLDGLLDAAGALESSDVLANGPDGGGGCCYAFPPVHPEGILPRMGCHAAVQEWTPAKPVPGGTKAQATGRFWIGFDKHSPPVPADLQRVDYQGGIPVLLADGRDWYIPAMQFLPHRYALNDRGIWSRQVKPIYAELYARVEKAYGVFHAERQGEDIPVAYFGQLAADVLGINYRINSDILDRLDLLNDDNSLYVLGATFGYWRTPEGEFLKKTGQASRNSGSRSQTNFAVDGIPVG